MAIDVNEEVLIKSTREKVARVMFNPKLDKIWIRRLRGVYPMKTGLYEKNAKVERVGDFMNRRYSSKLLVTKYEENRFVEMYADEPFEMNIRYELKEEGAEETLTNISITSFGEILYNSPVPIIAKNLSEIIQDDLKRLKKHIETME